MRQLLAALVLLCFGITVPTAAMDRRVCLLNLPSMGSAISPSEKAHPGHAKSCSDCCKKDKTCCAELKKQPDSTLQSSDSLLPGQVAVNLPPVAFRIPPPLVSDLRSYQAAVPIRGPDPPSLRRAVLAVWNI